MKRALVRPACTAAAVFVVMSTAVPALHGAVCDVPSGSYPTIQSAIDDVGCTEVVLAAQTFTESPVIDRDVILRGASSSSTIIKGQIEVQGGICEIRDLGVDAYVSAAPGSPDETLWVHSGGRVIGSRLVVITSSLLFADGFESGDTSAWVRTFP